MRDDIPTPEISEIRKLNVEPKIIETKTVSGTPVECSMAPYFKRSQNALHLYEDLPDVRYDIPTESDLNIAINVNEEGKAVPLGAMSIDLNEGVPTINMIQQVKAFKKEEGSEATAVDNIELGPVYERVEHPRGDLIKGKDKIQWQKLLIDEAIEVAKKNGYDKVRIVSGFGSKYLRHGHDLNLAVQHYDRLVNNDPTWVPYNAEGKPIEDPETLKLLKTTIRKLRDHEIDIVDAVRILPQGTRPYFYEKKMTQPTK